MIPVYFSAHSEGSPCPPIFQTPGMTQIMKVPPLNFDDDTTYKSIPAPPVFTPGFREIHASNSKKTNQDNVNSKTAAPDIYGGSTTKVLRSLTFNNEAPASQQSRLVESISMEPEEPEMTVSLEASTYLTKSSNRAPDNIRKINEIQFNIEIVEYIQDLIISTSKLF